jgi:hypothetical protein
VKVKSEPNSLQIVVIFGAGGLLFTFLGTVLIFLVAPYEKNQLAVTLIGSGLYLFVLVGIFTYFKNVPTITVTLEEIKIKYIYKSETIKVDDISDVQLYQKSDFSLFMMNLQMESTVVNLKDGSQRIFWDVMYESFGRVKNALELTLKPDRLEIIQKLKQELSRVIEPIDKRNLEAELFNDYKGNRLINFYGLIVLVGMVFIIYQTAIGNIGAIFIGIPIIVGPMGYYLHYFRISNNYFQVRNFIWLWKCNTYRIEDIMEIIHELPHRTPESLRIRLKNYQTSNLQPAESLNEEDWKRLFEELLKKNIAIRSYLHGNLLPSENSVK